MTRWQVLLGVAVAGLVAAGPAVYSSHRQTHQRNFRVVEHGVLYRSGQLTRPGLERIMHDYRIKTVVTLRTVRPPHTTYHDAWEEEVCDAFGAKHVRIIPQVWGENEKGEIPATEMIEKFLKVTDDPANYPVLVHCFAGIHRTGHMCAIFRMEYHGWSADEAITEMQLYGYDPEDMHEHIEGYLRKYTPRKKR
jgi:tyrosine-protein phosphatase SIW14